MAEKYVPEQIQKFVDAALALARNDNIGYCQWENGQDLMCTEFVSKALTNAGMPSYSNIHAAQPVTDEAGWKTYPFDAKKVWPGDILITQGKHAGIAVGWGGPVAEAVTSGPRPAPNDYKTFTDVKTGADYPYAIKLSGAGDYSFDYGRNKYYQVETAKVAYNSYTTGGYYYYKLKTFPWSTISEADYKNLSATEQAKYERKYEPIDTKYKYGTLTYYKRHDDEDFWPEPKDQGGEVIDNGSVSGEGRTHIIRYIKAWLGIDHFEPNFTGHALKIP